MVAINVSLQSTALFAGCPCDSANPNNQVLAERRSTPPRRRASSLGRRHRQRLAVLADGLARLRQRVRSAW
jgi:hypothetical protein